MNQLEKFNDIETFIFDVDGVLTNSQIWVLENGKLLQKMSIRDTFAIQQAIEKGYRIAIISGGKSEGVKKRLIELGVTDFFMEQKDKKEAYESYLEIYELDAEKVLYMGDEWPDYEVMRKVGLPACPADAAPELFKIALYVSAFNGGDGCVRDVIEKVMRLHGNWFEE